MGNVFSSETTYVGAREILREIKYEEYLSEAIKRERFVEYDNNNGRTRVKRPMNTLVLGRMDAGKSCTRSTIGTTNYLHTCGIWNGNFPLNNGQRTTVTYEFTEMEYYFTKNRRHKEIVMRIFEIPGDNYQGDNIKLVLRRVLNGLEEGTILCENEEIKDVKDIPLLKNKIENKIDSIILVSTLNRTERIIKQELDSMYDVVKEVVDQMNNDSECADIPIYCVLTHLEGNQVKNVDFTKRIRHRVFRIENYQAEHLNMDQEFNNSVKINCGWFDNERSVAIKTISENPRLVVPFYREDTHQTARKIVKTLFKNDPLNSLRGLVLNIREENENLGPIDDEEEDHHHQHQHHTNLNLGGNNKKKEEEYDS